jgi:S1-C subfamily serine protease
MIKISFIQTETRTLRVETKRQTDVVCKFSSTPKGGFASAWKKLKKIYQWLVSIICVAVFITDDGYLISNYHVVKDATKVRLLTSAGLIDAKVVQVDAANDLALLKADGRFAPLPTAASRTVNLGGTVATVGFSDIGLQGFAPKLAKGEIASLSGAADDPRYFQISVPVQPGNSGGALVDERGNVIGIVSAKLDASAALAASGALPENVNYAVKSSLLLSFLESVPDVSAKLKSPNTKDEKFSDVVKSAQDAAVLVLVY